MSEFWVWLGKGANMTVADDDLTRLVNRVVAESGNVVAARLERAARRVGVPAYSRWPVGRVRKRKVPHSKDELSWGLRFPGPGVIEAFVLNQAAHAIYVKSFKNGLRGKSAVWTLLRKPLKAEAELVAADLKGELADQAQRLLGGSGG